MSLYSSYLACNCISPCNCWWLLKLAIVLKHLASSARSSKVEDTLQDVEQLHNGLKNICAWSEKWQMKLNVDKCVLLRCTQSLAPVLCTYVLNGYTLVSKTQHPYLGIVFDSTMSWSTHIQMVSNRATKVLNFVK